MNSDEVASLIGRPWATVADRDWLDWYPVLEDEQVVAVVPATTGILDAARRGFVYDTSVEVFRVNWPLSDLVEVLLRFDGGAYGQPDRAAAVAQEWATAGFAADATRRWLAVGVCYASHAAQLQAAGLTPADLVGVFGGWATAEVVDQLLDPV